MSFLKELKDNKILLVIILVGGIMIFFSIRSCMFNYTQKHISKNLELNINNCQIDEEVDTHGGFLGDGDYYAKLICTETEDNKIKNEWNNLPISIELEKVMNLEMCDDGCKNVYEKYSIPKIEEGYYYFLDRHKEAKDKHNEEELNNRSSYNFSVGIYDSNTKIVYFYELDT